MFTPSSIELLNPKEFSLLAILSDVMTPELLRIISEADYGYSSDKHLSALEEILATFKIPAPLKWEPREVLELIRWSKPSLPDWKPGLTGREGHLIRAFSCAVLLVAAANEKTRDFIDDENSTLAPLVESLGVLGIEYQVAGLSEIAWRVQNPPDMWEDEPFFLLSMLVLAVNVFGPKQAVLIEELIDLCFSAEDRVRNADWCLCREDSSAWLFGLTYFDLNREIWVSFASGFRTSAVKFGDGIAKKLTLVADLLEGKANAD